MVSLVVESNLQEEDSVMVFEEVLNYGFLICD